MKYQGKIETYNQGVRRLVLKEDFHEHIKLRQNSGFEVYANFELSIIKNELNEIGLIIEAENADHIHVIKLGVENAINAILKQYRIRKIDFNGVDIHIKNYKFHAVDSKPMGYELPIKERIIELVEEHKFHRKVDIYEKQSQIFNLEKLETPTVEKYRYPEKSIFIHCPNTKKETLVLNKAWKLTVLIDENRYNKRRSEYYLEVKSRVVPIETSRIALKFEEKIELVDCVSIVKHIDEFKNLITNDRNANLGGLIIRVSKKQKDGIEIPFSSSMIFNSTCWSLLNLYSNEDNYTRVKIGG